MGLPSRATFPAGQYPDLAPPVRPESWLTLLGRGLFGSVSSTALTLLAIAFLLWTVPGLVQWAILEADASGQSRQDCTGEGACWAVITARWRLFLYNFYPDDQAWRLGLAALLLPVAVAPLLYDLPRRGLWLAFTAVYPLAAFWLVRGGAGLEVVSTALWGGLMLTLILGVAGIAASLPIGILLALGRRSDLPAIRGLSVVFIETVRGVPLVTILFFASVMLPLFLPEGLNTDKLARAMLVITVFASAYMAEVVRGGLQSIPAGQGEAARALGLSEASVMTFIVLPQALRVSIPGIVNTFIGLFKDTSLVFFAIGLFEIVGVGESTLTNQDWIGLKTEVYLFVGAVFWIICFGMSRLSLSLERRQGGRRTDP
ncbi:MAG: amino acid ABC transporter permease [Alphaproteobacteria bacterium]